MDAVLDEIDDMIKSGLGDEAVKKSLISRGWPEHVLDLIMHEVHIPHNKLESLKKYIKNQLAKGRSKKQIKQILMDAGWTEDIVELGLNFFDLK